MEGKIGIPELLLILVIALLGFWAKQAGRFGQKLG